MFEVFYKDCEFPIAKFLYKSDAEMFIDVTEKKLPDLAKGYYIVDKRFSTKKRGLLDRIKKMIFPKHA